MTKENVTVLFGSWIHLNKDHSLYDIISDKIDVYFEDIDYLDDIFRGLKPSDRFEVFLKFIKDFCSKDKHKVFITANPDFTDYIKNFYDYNKISYKFIMFNVINVDNKFGLEFKDLGESIVEIFKDSNTEWQRIGEKFYTGDNN